MFRLRNGLTARKLRQAILLASGLSVVLATVTFVSFDRARRRRDAFQEARLVSSLTASRLDLAARKNRRGGVGRTLGRLKDRPNVVSAFLFGTDGRVIARYVRGNPRARLQAPKLRLAGDYRTKDMVISYRTITMVGRVPETLCLTFDTSGFLGSWKPLAGITLALLASSLLLALLLSREVQQAIAEPILELARAALRVAVEKNYSLRAPVVSQNEVGFLAERFNKMMAQIESTNAALEASRQSLEFRVAERTAELQQEIADRERAQKELEEHSARLGALVRHNPLAIVVLDAEQRIQMCNTAFENTFGYRSEEITGENLDELIVPPQFHSEVEELILRLQRGELVRAETRRRRKDGKLIDVSATALLLKVNENIIGTYVLYEDITQRKQAEQALRRSEQQYRNLFGQIPDSVFVFDAETHLFVHCNQTASRHYGYSLKELCRMTPLHLHPPEERKRAGSQLATLNPNAPFQSVHVARNGRRIDVETHAAQISFEGRRAWLTIARDVTVSHQARQELERAKEAAEQANKAKSEFLANMSHEIRTPMNGILGMTTLALETELTGEQREYLGLVKSSADSLLLLLNDILDFAKIESGKIDFEKIPFSVKKGLGQKMKSLGHLAFSKGIELAWRVRPDVPDELVGDPSRLQQVLVNLVGNSIKFTEQGEVVVDLSLESTDVGTVQLHFAVRDTGIGIPEAQRCRIFDAFTQADSSTTRKFGGTGLGLAIAKYLVERMGGRIWVESEPGHGSTFHFTARFETAPADPPISRLQPAAKVEGRRVLIVDDNPVNRLILMELLRNWRVDAEEVASAPATLQALRRARTAGHPFELAIVDAQMPEVDGFTLVRRIKGDPELARTSVILLSSISHPAKRSGMWGAGIAAFLSKPVQQSELLDTLLAVINGGSSGSKTETPTPVATKPVAANGGRVLLAEDNAVNRRLAARLIEKQGCTPVLATNGKKVLELLSSQAVDLILMDVQMPELDGLETTRRIREREKSTGGHLPIVVLTAHAMKGDRERCLAAGADDYLAKPIEPAGIAALFQRYLHPAESGEATGDAASEDGAIDAVSVLKRLEGDRELLAEMAQIFEGEASILTGKVREALAKKHFQDLQSAAHTLKGAVANFGAGAAFRAAEKLEWAARDGSAERAIKAVDQIEVTLKRLGDSLEPFRAGVSE